MLNNVKNKKQMLNNVKIFFKILYVSVKLTWTGKVDQ